MEKYEKLMIDCLSNVKFFREEWKIDNFKLIMIPVNEVLEMAQVASSINPNAYQSYSGLKLFTEDEPGLIYNYKIYYSNSFFKNKLIGFLMWNFYKNEIYIRGFQLFPLYRKRKYGTFFIKKLLLEFKKEFKNVDAVSLIAVDSCGFWSKVGFVQCDNNKEPRMKFYLKDEL